MQQKACKNDADDFYDDESEIENAKLEKDKNIFIVSMNEINEYRRM